jgi:hypothetical protein
LTNEQESFEGAYEDEWSGRSEAERAATEAAREAADEFACRDPQAQKILGRLKHKRRERKRRP